MGCSVGGGCSWPCGLVLSSFLAVVLGSDRGGWNCLQLLSNHFLRMGLGGGFYLLGLGPEKGIILICTITYIFLTTSLSVGARVGRFFYCFFFTSGF